jgi:SAM-dependent MidA family methyltransferase
MTPLEPELRRIIATDGPMPVGRFMALCLGHPVHGYYVSGDPIGAGGDFITAPEISQMFGELIGLWAAAVWQQMGSPGAIRLVELGPGRGTLMADALRAAKVVPGFRSALAVDLIELSPVLRRCQEEALAAAGVPIVWRGDMSEVPDGPLIVIANEFVDALPVDQLVRDADGWHVRMVGLDADGRFVFALNPDPLPRSDAVVPRELRDAPVGSLCELRSYAPIAALAERFAQHGGAGLVIDYGYVETAAGETLQAVGRHRFVSALDSPGKVDLTAHVDFAALGRVMAGIGAAVHGPVTQRQLLCRLGIEARAAKLKSTASTQAVAIDAALARLTGAGPNHMGELFKAIAFSAPQLGALPGFDGSS